MHISWPALVWIVSLSSMFAFLSIFWWALQRRREREAYYRYELARQLLDRVEKTSQHEYLDWLKEQDEIENRRRWQGLLLGAVVLIATGAGFMLALRRLSGDESVMGWVPLLIGIAMLVYLWITRGGGGRRPDTSNPSRRDSS